MKVKFIKSIITCLPNFNGSIEHQGGLHQDEYIYWYKLDNNGNYEGFSKDEVLDLFNLINSKCTKNVRSSSIEEVEEDDIPYVAFSPARTMPIEYELSKLFDYSNDFEFEITGYLPANHNML